MPLLDLLDDVLYEVFAIIARDQIRNSSYCYKDNTVAGVLRLAGTCRRLRSFYLENECSLLCVMLQKLAGDSYGDALSIAKRERGKGDSDPLDVDTIRTAIKNHSKIRNLSHQVGDYNDNEQFSWHKNADGWISVAYHYAAHGLEDAFAEYVSTMEKDSLKIELLSFYKVDVAANMAEARKILAARIVYVSFMACQRASEAPPKHFEFLRIVERTLIQREAWRVLAKAMEMRAEARYARPFATKRKMEREADVMLMGALAD